MKNVFCTLALACMAVSVSLAQDLATRQYSAGRVILQSGDTLVGPVVHYLEQDMLQVMSAKQLPIMLSASAVQSFVTNAALTPTAASVSDVYKRYNDTPNGAVYSVVEPLTTIRKVAPSQTVEYDAAHRHQFISLAWTPDIINGQKEAFGFFELLAIGKVALVQRESSKLTSGSQYYNGFSAPEGVAYRSVIDERAKQDDKASHMFREVQERERTASATVKLVSTLYLIDEVGKIQQITGSGEKQVLQCFPGQATKLQKYKRQHNLSWVKSEDIVRLVAYGNSLQKQ